MRLFHSECPVIRKSNNQTHMVPWLVEKKPFPLPFRGGGNKKGDKKETKTGAIGSNGKVNKGENKADRGTSNG